jgi:hypothetical protein
MLGKLARTLRILGFDTKYVRHEEREKILAQSLKEKRILLTRAHNFPKIENIFVINSEKIEPQLKELEKRFNISTQIKPFTRCLVCNTPLVSVNKDKVKGKVPFYIYETHKEFVYCKECNKFYWKGTHYQDMQKMVDELKVLNPNIKNTFQH